jgi:hypothetical protein
MFQLMLELHALRASVKYNADQPRAPAGQPNGGQWVGGGGEAAGSTRDADMLLAGNLEKLDPNINIGQFVSDNCKGSVRREIPGQFYGMTIGEMLSLRRAGDRAADTCYKLLDRGEIQKMTNNKILKPGLTGLIEFLKFLDKQRIKYDLEYDLSDAISVCFMVVGAKFEVDFFETHVTYNFYIGNEEVHRDENQFMSILAER